jgi:hypothetical protein
MVEKAPVSLGASEIPKTPIEIRKRHMELVNKCAGNGSVLNEGDETEVRVFLQAAAATANTSMNNPDRLAVKDVVDWWLGPLGIKQEENPYVIKLGKSPKKRRFGIF